MQTMQRAFTTLGELEFYSQLEEFLAHMANKYAANGVTAPVGTPLSAQLLAQQRAGALHLMAAQVNALAQLLL